MDSPALKRLMSAYLHQDYDVVHGSIDGAVHDFVQSEPADAATICAEIYTVLAAAHSDAELGRLLRSWGSFVAVDQMGLTYREWLTDLAHQVTTVLASAPTGDRAAG